MGTLMEGCPKNGVSKSIVHVMKQDVNFQLYWTYPTGVIWKNQQFTIFIGKTDKLRRFIQMSLTLNTSSDAFL